MATPLNQIKAINGAGSFQVLGRHLINGTTRALVDTAINGGSLGDNLTRSIATAFIDTGAALGATAIGANTAPGSFANFAGHFIAGCAAGALRADSSAGCGAGAIGATLGEATALMLNGNRTAEDILANGLLPGTLEMASLVGGLGVALAGGDASLVYLGAGAGSNAAENNMVGQITMLAQNVARFSQIGWQGLSAAGQAAILRCAASNWCASLPLMAVAVAHVNSTQFVASQPSLADQIPTGYGAGGVRMLDSSTSTSAEVLQAENTTATPGVALNNSGTPGYGMVSPSPGGASTSVPNNGPLGGAIVLNEGVRLNNQLAAEQIANGHAFDKHVHEQNEFGGSIETRQQFANLIENILNHPSAVRQLSNGRSAYWDDASGVVVIRNPNAADGGTAFRPANGRSYFNNLR